MNHVEGAAVRKRALQIACRPRACAPSVWACMQGDNNNDVTTTTMGNERTTTTMGLVRASADIMSRPSARQGRVGPLRQLRIIRACICTRRTTVATTNHH